MITSLISPLKIIILNCFVTKQCIKSISSEATQSKQKGMEWNGAPPQWFVVFVRLSLQVQKAAVRWQTITGSLMASVFAVSTAAGPLGMGKWRTKKPCNLFHLLSLSTDMCVSLSQLTSLLWPNSPCPFSYCGDHLTCLLLLLCFCSLKPSPLSPQSLPWSLLPNSSVKHLKTVTM